MRRLGVFAAVFVLVASACGVAGQGGDELTVLVDFSHDEFASAMFANFPKEAEVLPGTTLIFKQTWTGEPHTVTGGTLVDELLSKAEPWSALFGAFERLMGSGADIPDPENPEGSAAEFFSTIEEAEDDAAKRDFQQAYDALVEQGVPLPDRQNPKDATFEEVSKTIDEESNKLFEEPGVPWAFDENEEGAFITQNAGQPCYLDEGAPPKDADKACDESDQRQPTFDGKASYYNSGIIPYEGPQGNTFRIQLSDDIEPGSYFFYCAVHGPDQQTEVKVRPEGSEIPSQTDVSRTARKEIDDFSKPMLEAFREASDGKIDRDGETTEAPFGGVNAPVHGSINEFVPKTIETEVGEEVNWKLMGADHTITFGVPEYFPIIQFRPAGTVRINPKLQVPAGGSPKIPEQEGEGILRVDGGTYDGSGFYSSGLFGAQPYAEYTLRFSKAGSYKYACLLHPPMVGTVDVT